MLFRFYLLICGLVLCSCSDSTIMKIQEREPQIVVHPEFIDFGNLTSGSESGVSYFTIINVGDDTLFIDPPQLNDNSTRFSISYDDVDQLEPGELLDIDVLYSPETYETNLADIQILSNDLEKPELSVEITGNGDAPVITLNPEGHDFGTISMGCDNELRLTIGNEGNLPLEITGVSQMVTQPVDIIMDFGSLPPVPWSVDPGIELDIITSYAPSDVGPDSSIISIDSNDPMTPVATFEEIGVGQVEQWVTDQFIQEEIPLLDVLWVIDNSGSMNMIQSSVASHIDDFMTVFLAASPDYHMAFITTDSPVFEGGQFLDMTTPNPDYLASAIVSGIGTSGAGMEKGIQYAKQSTSSPNWAGPGGAFFREDATLVIIFVSDEKDHSLNSWASYLTYFDNLKDSDKFLPVAIVGDSPSGCTFHYGSSSRNIEFGAGYYDFAMHYGGQFYSVCATDWGIQMEDLASTVATKRIFNLSEPDPIEDTIEVYVNGQLTTTWEYNPVENHVAFEPGSEPAEGNTIEIIYATWGCD